MHWKKVKSKRRTDRSAERSPGTPVTRPLDGSAAGNYTLTEPYPSVERAPGTPVTRPPAGSAADRFTLTELYPSVERAPGTPVTRPPYGSAADRFTLTELYPSVELSELAEPFQNDPKPNWRENLARTKVAEAENQGVNQTRVATRTPLFGGRDAQFRVFRKADQEAKEEAAKDTGIPQDNPRKPARAVASSRLDAALGFGVTSRDSFWNGGVESREVFDGRGRPLAVRRHETAEKENYRLAGMPEHTWDKPIPYVDPEIDLRNPTTQRDLWTLQLEDSITNQADRHAGNMMLDEETGHVRGIDNDVSFGTIDGAGKGMSKLPGLPHLIDREAANRVSAMTEDDLRRLLTKAKARPRLKVERSGPRMSTTQQLTDEEIKAAVERLKRVKDHINQTEVENPKNLIERHEWGEDTYRRALGKADAPGDAETPDSYLRDAHRGQQKQVEKRRVHAENERRRVDAEVRAEPLAGNHVGVRPENGA